MPKLLIISTSFQRGGAGKIARGLAAAAAKGGWDVLAAHSSRFGAPLPDGVEGLRLGSAASERLHATAGYLIDGEGLFSVSATRRLIEAARRFRPDVINLHNVHGHYLNTGLLFDFLRLTGTPTVWTLHDQWAMTGRCASPEAASCEGYLNGCGECPRTDGYPRSLIDRSRRNLKAKAERLASLPNLRLIAPAQWLAEEAGRTFLGQYPIDVIPNGVDLDTFAPAAGQKAEPCSVLAVASKWTRDKGLDDMIALRQRLGDRYHITLAGVTSAQRRALAGHGIEGIERTESPEALADLYRRAKVTVSTSFADTFPTVLLESLACGTPAVAYRTRGAREIVDEGCGTVVPKGDIAALAAGVEEICRRGKSAFSASCRERAISGYDREKTHARYLNLFNSML